MFHGFYNIQAIFPLPKRPQTLLVWQLKSWEPFVFASAFAMTRTYMLQDGLILRLLVPNVITVCAITTLAQDSWNNCGRGR